GHFSRIVPVHPRPDSRSHPYSYDCPGHVVVVASARRERAATAALGLAHGGQHWDRLASQRADRRSVSRRRGTSLFTANQTTFRTSNLGAVAAVLRHAHHPPDRCPLARAGGHPQPSVLLFLN